MSRKIISSLILVVIVTVLARGALARTSIVPGLGSDEFAGSSVTSPLVGQTWIKLGGPLGGLGYDIRMRPDNPDIMYATDAWAGIHMSTDGGRTWASINNGIDARTGPSGDAVPVFCATIDPNNHDIVWVGTQNSRGIYRSEDGGNTWEKRTAGIVEDNGITIRGIAVEPGNSNVVYAAAEISGFVWAGRNMLGREFDRTKGVVYKSTDAGKHWQAVWRGDNLARYVLINPDYVNTIYVSTGIFDREAANSDPATNTPGGVGILKSTDGGKTWFQVNNGLDNLYIGTLVMHPENPDILLAGAGNNAYRDGGGIYLTVDSGEHWEYMDGKHITSVEFAAGNPDVAYASSGEDKFYRSDDGGYNWQAYERPGGKGWGPEGIRPGFPIDFQVDPRDVNRIFVNNYGGGNLLSEDGGQTWASASKGYTGAQLHSLAVDPSDARYIYTIGRSGPFRSVNGGRDWQGIAFPPALFAEWNAVAMNPEDPWEVLIADEFEGSLFHSRDGGGTWVLVFQQPLAGGGPSNRHGFKAIAYAPSDPQVVYAGMRKGRRSINGDFPPEPSFGVYRSTDGGLTWHERNDSHTASRNINVLAVDPRDPNTVYAATFKGGVFKSSNGGQTWQPVNQGLRVLDVRTLVIDPQNPEVLYAGVENGGVYKSVNGGEHWQRSNNGLDPQAAIRAIVVDPADPTTLYAADFHTGVYHSENGGQLWTRINEGLSTRAVKALAVSSDGKVLYAATEGEGVFRLGEPPPGTAPAPTPTPKPPETVPPTTVPEDLILPETEAEVVFLEDFEGGIQNWSLGEGWQLEKVGVNAVLEGRGHQWVRLRDRSWDNYVVGVEFKLVQGGIHFNYRWNEDAGGLRRYFIGTGSDSLYLRKQIGQEFYELATVQLKLSEGWHRIEVRGQEDVINISLDGRLLIAYRDEKPILSGGIAFETLDDSVCLIDEVEIRQAKAPTGEEEIPKEIEPEPPAMSPPPAEPEDKEMPVEQPETTKPPATERPTAMGDSIIKFMPYLVGTVVFMAAAGWGLWRWRSRRRR